MDKEYMKFLEMERMKYNITQANHSYSTGISKIL